MVPDDDSLVATYTKCPHCGGSTTCNCATCGTLSPNEYVRSSGVCQVCHGAGGEWTRYDKKKTKETSKLAFVVFVVVAAALIYVVVSLLTGAQ